MAVLAEFGLELPAEVAVVVHDSTAELRYMVVPERPSGLGWLPDGRLLVVSMRDRCLLRVDGSKRAIVQPEATNAVLDLTALNAVTIYRLA